MDFFTIFLIIAAAGAALGLRYKFKPSKPGPNVLDNPFDEKEIKKRKEHLDKTFIYAQEKKKVTVEEVQKHLKISEPDAVRYLEHLVTFGKLSKVNERGQKVFYISLS